MKKVLMAALIGCQLVSVCSAQVEKMKRVDEGGSGPYKAIAVSEPSLPNFVVYRPEQLVAAVKASGKLPVLVWANGGCMNSSIGHERVLTEIASHGYAIVAIGALQMTLQERRHLPTPDTMLLDALAWVINQTSTPGSPYHAYLDPTKMAAGGQSCGGAQTIRVAGDTRIKSYMMFNSGMGDMTMAGASTQLLSKLNGPIIYIVGGEPDIATRNAIVDYERINHVPAVFANLLQGGHMGTFGEQFGGSFARMAIDWLDWQFKGKDKSTLFLKSQLTDYPGWALSSKNFKQ